MLTPSSGTLADYNSAVLGGNATHVRIVFPVQNKTFTDGEIAMDGGLSITQIMNPETDLTMGNAVSSELNVLFLNNGQFSGFNWTEEFHVDFGVDIGGTTNWVTVGYFKGKKPERIKRTEVIDFTAYDRMTMFDVLADDFIASLSFPMTMSQIYSALCTHVGITSVSGDEMANAMAMSYTENPFPTGITCRQILAWIAEANCCYAKINASGNVKLYWFTDQTSAYSLTGDDYFAINMDEEDAPAVDSVRISSSEEDTTGFVYPVGGSVIYQIVDNPLLWELSSANKTVVITDMVTRFTAIGSYTPCELTAMGNWMVETGDIIEVGYDGVSTMNMPVFSRAIRWNGGCVDGYECTGSAERQVMTSSDMEHYEEGGKLAKKYTIQSGVDITDEGVTVSGGKFVKIISGGVLDVQSQNFILDSATGKMQSGGFVYDSNGVTLIETYHVNTPQGTDHEIGLRLGNTNVPTGVDAVGYVDIVGEGVYPNYAFSDLVIGINSSSAYNRYIKFAYGDASIDTHVSPDTNRLLIYPYASNIIEVNGRVSGEGVCLGTSGLPFIEGHFRRLFGDAVANSLDVSDAGYVLDARQAANLSQSIHLTSTDTTWAKVWEKINTLVNGTSATIFIHENAISPFTKSTITAGAWAGIITRKAASAFMMILRSAGGQIRVGDMTGASSSALTTWTDTRFFERSNAVYETGGASYSFGTAVYGFGVVGNSNKRIVLQFPLFRSVPSGWGNYTLTSLKICVRGATGTVDIFSAISNEYIGTSGYSFSVDMNNYGGCLQITINKTSALTNSVNGMAVTATMTCAFEAPSS